MTCPAVSGGDWTVGPGRGFSSGDSSGLLHGRDGLNFGAFGLAYLLGSYSDFVGVGFVVQAQLGLLLNVFFGRYSVTRGVQVEDSSHCCDKTMYFE